MAIRIKRAKRGDVLIEPGGRWPRDAWEVKASWTDLTEISRPPWYHSFWGRGHETKTIPNRSLVGWHRVKSPEIIFNQEINVRVGKPPHTARIWAEAIHGNGAVVFVKPGAGHMAEIAMASEDIEKAIAVAEGLTRFELPPLEVWVVAPPEVLEHGHSVWETATPAGPIELDGFPDGAWTLDGLGFRRDQNTYWSAEKAWQDAQDELSSSDPQAE